jgi:phenylacetate-coenzyme A ligase PaaK-like adenylate-forming protein
MTVDAGSYETTRLAHMAYAQQLLPAYLARLGWSREQIEEEQTRALRALLRHALARSPWHRARLERLDVEHITPARLAEIPPMTKGELMQHWDAIVTEPGCSLAAAEAHLEGLSDDAYFHGDLHVIASGGSSGVRGVFLYGWHGWAVSYLGVMRGMQGALARLANPPAGPMASVTAYSPSHATRAIQQTFRRPERPTVQAPVNWPLERIVATLNEARPGVLSCYASMLPVLVEEARAGRLRIAPALVCGTAEPLLPELREAAAAAWGARVLNLFATSESIALAFPCPLGAGLHIAEDLNIVELVDASGAPVAPGARSARILITNLYNPSLPLIRYEISDELEAAKGPCACGSAYLGVADVQGRAEDLFRYAAGLRVHPLQLRSAIAVDPAVLEYQVRQTERGADVDVTARSGVDLAAIQAALEARLRALRLEAPEVHVRQVEALERQGSGKLRRFVPCS